VSAAEILIAISLIGVLIAILLPAVNMSRSSARMMECRNRLHQFGVALQGFQSQWRALPGTLADNTGLSVHVQLLPWLEHDELYHQFVSASSASDSVGDRFSRFLELSRAHHVSSFVCPEDAGNALSNLAVNYCANMGVSNPEGWSSSGSGMFTWGQRGLQPEARFRDGLSNIVTFSEQLSRVPSEPAATGVQQSLLVRRLPEDSRDIEGFRKRCTESLAEFPVVRLRWTGICWYQTLVGEAGYTHDLPPFSLSCWNSTRIKRSIASARSLHGDTVNALFGDGAVRGIARDIDANVWRALGVRDDGHVVGF
jgi:prepilin-type processing-associated H-X9-DG protein